MFFFVLLWLLFPREKKRENKYRIQQHTSLEIYAKKRICLYNMLYIILFMFKYTCDCYKHMGENLNLRTPSTAHNKYYKNCYLCTEFLFRKYLSCVKIIRKSFHTDMPKEMINFLKNIYIYM